jgi:HAMP domain-containing protein
MTTPNRRIRWFGDIRRFWRDLSLESKFASFAILLVLVITALPLLTIAQRRQSLRGELETQAKSLLSAMASSTVLENVYYFVDVRAMQEEVERTLDQNPGIARLKVYTDDGKVWVEGGWPDGCPDAEDSASCQPQVASYNPNPDTASQDFLQLPPGKIHTDWEQGQFVVGQSVWIGNEVRGAVEIDFSTAGLEKDLASLRWLYVWPLGGLVLGVWLARRVARQLTRPINELIQTTDRMADGDLSTRFPSERQDEIGQLGRAFNDMATAIEKRDADLRELARGLEHQVNQRTLEIQQKNRYLEALQEITPGLIENLDVESLLKTIMARAASLAETEHAFVNIVVPERNEMQRRVAQGRYEADLGEWTKPGHGLSGRVMASGEMIIAEDYQLFEGVDPAYQWLRTAIYMPLKAEAVVLGVIGLGYEEVVSVNREQVAILQQFALLASLALKGAQLYTATRDELTEAERALVAEEERRRVHLASPAGRAETVAESILKDPSGGLIVLHELAQNAEQDGNAAILPELAGALEQTGQKLLADLAEGYHWIFQSPSDRELLLAGLRRLRSRLNLPEARTLQEADRAAVVFGLCREAIEAESIHAATQLIPSLRALSSEIEAQGMLAELAGSLEAVLSAAELLHSVERVDTTEDKRAYLTAALERLSHADRVAHTLHGAERPIAQRIVQDWMTIVTGSLSDLQTRAQISCKLVAPNIWESETITVALGLRNEGHGMALNLRVRLIESPEYEIVSDPAVVERLPKDEEAHVELEVRPQVSTASQFRAQFAIAYDDPRGLNQVQHFADLVQLLAPTAAFQLIPNPYLAGRPLKAGSPLFFGREDLFAFIGENLAAAHPNNLVLIGQRRTGKSSLLNQLPLRLGERFVPVNLDGQAIAADPGLPSFFLNVATRIGFELEERGFKVSIPRLIDFTDHPAQTFEHDFLRRVRQVIGERHLVLMLDEFEELEAAARRGTLDASVFGVIRHLVQHEPALSLILCGTHRIEELASDYWNVLFNISLYKHVGSLDYGEAMRLIQEPVAGFGMRYDDLALDRMWRVTAGHPYFLQLLCHSMVNGHNRSGRSYVNISDVNSALDEILSYGEAHFVYLWNESSQSERKVLTALSRMIPLAGRVTPVQVEDYLVERGFPLDRHDIGETLHHLALRDILVMQAEGGLAGVAVIYAWRLGLLALWIGKYKSLSMIREEGRA